MEQKRKHSAVFVMARTLILGYVLTALLLFLLAFFMYRFGMTEKQAGLCIFAVYFLTCFLGGIIIGRYYGRKRLIWGIVFGLFYFLVLFILSMIMNQQLYHGSTNFFLVLGTTVIGGALGGAVS